MCASALSHLLVAIVRSKFASGAVARMVGLWRLGGAWCDALAPAWCCHGGGARMVVGSMCGLGPAVAACRLFPRSGCLSLHLVPWWCWAGARTLRTPRTYVIREGRLPNLTPLRQTWTHLCNGPSGGAVLAAPANRSRRYATVYSVIVLRLVQHSVEQYPHTRASNTMIVLRCCVHGVLRPSVC